MKANEIQDLSAKEKELLIRVIVVMIGICKDLKLPRKAVADGMKRLWDHVDENKYGGPIVKLLDGK